MFVSLALAFLAPQQPLFSFVHTSDSQPNTATDQRNFEEVLDVIVASGTAGALLPRRVSFVLFAGDLVDSNNESEWDSFDATVASRLTARGIPLLAAPGNHDKSGTNFSLYERHIGPTAPWGAGSAALVGQNGASASTGWEGLRFIGLNNTNGGDNRVSTTDRQAVEARVSAASAARENVFLICHHEHDAGAGIQLLGALENGSVIGYMRGHNGSPHAARGLRGVDNPNVWEFDTNNIFEDGALIYFEAFTNELRAYVLQLRTNPRALPAPLRIPLVHALRAAGSDPGAGPGLRLAPVADTYVSSSAPGANFGSETELRVDDGDTRLRTFLRFDLSSLQGAPVVRATLRLFCTDSSSDGGALFGVSSSWSETGLTNLNAPAVPGTPLLAARTVTSGSWSELDVTTAIVNGTRAFALVGNSTNGARYASKERSNAPELVLEVGSVPAPTIASLAPPTVEPFVPGTQQTLRVDGSGFGTGTTVELDGTALAPSAMTVLDTGHLTLDLPRTSIGAHTLRVRTASGTATAPIQVVAASGPRLQLGTGDPANVVADNQRLRVLVAGPVGSTQIVAVSTTLAPSSNRFVSLAIGGGFADLSILAQVVVPSAGFVELNFPVNVAAPLTAYGQSLSRDSAFPLPVSALQSVRLVP